MYQFKISNYLNLYFDISFVQSIFINRRKTKCPNCAKSKITAADGSTHANFISLITNLQFFYLFFLIFALSFLCDSNINTIEEKDLLNIWLKS